jgi:serine/threonine-protein kinase
MTPGELLGDRYRLVARLGQGGSADVWRARDQLLDRPVAVKLPSPHAAGDTATVHRLRAEAQTAARLHHPHVVGVYDVGEVAGPDGRSLPYLVLELVEGRPLSEALEDRPLPWPVAVQICAQVAAGLAAAHERGIVHRDVKPGNVMLTDHGAKLVDFGISASIGEIDVGPDGELLCTPTYLAPERLETGPVRAACDVYALGLLLYQSLTGELPWEWDGMTQLLTAHQHGVPASLDRVPGLPPGVADLYQRCLAKLPADRPTSAEAARILAAAAAAAPAAATPEAAARPASLAEVGSSVVAAAPGGTDGSATRRHRIVGRQPAPTVGARPGTPRPQSRRRTHRALAAAGLLLAASLLASRPLLLDEPPSPPPPAAAACQVQYDVRQDSGDQFAAGITVSHTGPAPVPHWRLAFTFPADQRIVGWSAGSWQQSGRSVTVEAAGRDLALPAEGSTELVFQGDYQNTNPLPTGFRLNGTECARVLTAAPGGGDPAAVEPGSGDSSGGPTQEAGGGRNSRGGPDGKPGHPDTGPPDGDHPGRGRGNGHR